MRYWWVNQNQTYDFEVNEGYLWSPKANKNGARNHSYDQMKNAGPGDTVFSFSGTYIKAVGIVTARAISSDRSWIFRSVSNSIARHALPVIVARTRARDRIAQRQRRIASRGDRES